MVVVSLLCSAAANASVGDEVVEGAFAGGLIGQVVGAAAAAVVVRVAPEEGRVVGPRASAIWGVSTMGGIVLGSILAVPSGEDARAGLAGALGGSLAVAGPIGFLAWATGGIEESNSGWHALGLVSVAAIFFWPVTFVVIGALTLGVYSGFACGGGGVDEGCNLGPSVRRARTDEGSARPGRGQAASRIAPPALKL